MESMTSITPLHEQLTEFVFTGESVDISVANEIRDMDTVRRVETVGSVIASMALDELGDGPRSRVEWLQLIKSGEFRLLARMSTDFSTCGTISPSRGGLLAEDGVVRWGSWTASGCHSSGSRSRWLARQY